MLRSGLAEARALGLRSVEGTYLNSLAHIASDILADHVSALAMNQECLALTRALGNKMDEAVALVNVGTGLLWQGDFAGSERCLQEALQLSRSNGDRVSEAMTLPALSTLALWQGEDAQGLALARLAWDITVAVEARDQETMALIQLGRAEFALGRFAQAKQRFGEALGVALDIDHPRRYDAMAGIARVAMAQDDLTTAMREVTRLIAHVEAGGTFAGVESPRLVELTCDQVLEKVGDGCASEWIERAHADLQTAALAINDARARQAFLTQVPLHRELVTAWAARHNASD